ncbi:uncharacterized protein LOC123201315 isoform X3 [Mangifera indica]|uniref:uncharacterized protein LOC123201315 isoform X3 n=1 Tax=Mangifera indica TaxID=29780 RepID=UPI001CFA207B|nr:uncharacterized protein LOC123201315 isoform X3 [Mangifera indica]
MVTDKCLEILGKCKPENGEGDYAAVNSRAEAVKGLVELVHGNVESGGYAEALCIQQNRKNEGERMKRWAEAAWRNHPMSLADALQFSDPSNKVMVIDARTSRAI